MMTLPQIFIGERLVGGYDDMAALEREKKLDALLAGDVLR
jgi:glutaredoxin 3